MHMEPLSEKSQNWQGTLSWGVIMDPPACVLVIWTLNVLPKNSFYLFNQPREMKKENVFKRKNHICIEEKKKLNFQFW